MTKRIERFAKKKQLLQELLADLDLAMNETRVSAIWGHERGMFRLSAESSKYSVLQYQLYRN